MKTVLFFLATAAALVATISGAVAPEKALAKHLITSYEEIGIEGRPVKNPSEAVKVNVGLSLLRLVEADKTSVTFSAFLLMSWNDPFLDWEPSDYAGAQSVVIPSEDIWTPDITAFNDMYQGAEDLSDDMEDADALVMQDGTVMWVPRITIKAPCVPNGKNGQKCNFVLGSWAHSSQQIDVEFNENKADFDVSAFEKTPGLDLVSHSASIDDKEYDCCPGTKYTSITYTLDVKDTDQCDADGKC